MIESREVAIRGPAGTLEAILTAGPDPRFRAVIGHPHPLYGGTMQNGVVLETQSALLELRAEVLRFNFRGVGASEGEHSNGDAERYDLLAALETVRRRQPPLDTVLAGYSFGCGMALALLTSPKLVSRPLAEGLLCLAPPLTHYEVADLADLCLPIGLIYGEADSLTPHPLVRKNLQSWGPKVLSRSLAATGHDLGTSTNPQQLRSSLAEVLAWIVNSM